ncbi:PREDICTED: ralBP1-associated Eps domain-containing protein 1-like [Priapulus caudatus]|uniref:RalBP1-associated Eps domain-containing protein 1-like n=1 Tax=Priapulus caudatus TaxID=37621 RepID=A0ABM1EUB8_PRICU|nr:PREDICTED: ralBP1-associated Eps domain-containing protein 1-like [Priapulus caudatus]
MEALKLNEHEQRVYAELFTSCDVDNSGRVPWTKASEIFRASQLPGDTIQKILEICGAKRLGHFGRSQFYIALKLIAAAQVGLPLTTDTFNSGVELPTPKFARFGVAERPKLQQQQTYPMYGQVAPSAEAESAPSQPALERQQTLPGQLPPPPSKHSRTQSSSRPCELASTTYQQTTGGGAIGNYDHALSPPFSPTDAPSSSMQPLPGQAQQQPLPGQHHQQHPHTQQPYPGQHFVQPFPGQQHNQLHRWEFASPGEKQTNAGSQQQLPSDGHPRLPQQHRSDDDSGEAVSEEEEDVWLITEEQRQYYMNQFLTMQSDVDGLISYHYLSHYLTNLIMWRFGLVMMIFMGILMRYRSSLPPPPRIILDEM